MLDRNNPKPLYAQLEDILRTSIANGDWKENQLIPSENELSKRYGLSRMTVRSVITTLAKEGLLYRVQGKGTFVSKPKTVTNSPAYQGICEQLERYGREGETEKIVLECIHPNKKIIRLLELSEQDKITYLRRIRYVNGIPVSILTSYIPGDWCSQLEAWDAEKEPLCKLLYRACGLAAASSHESLESVLATEEEADLLELDNGHPLLLLEKVSKTKESKAIEYTRITFRGDKVKLSFDYQ